MSLIVVGLNHRTAPVEVLERAAVTRATLPKALTDLAKREHVAEVVVLTTCNRTEIYARGTKFHPAVQEVTDFLVDHAAVAAGELAEYLYTFHDAAAAAHLFGVASGIDSMILGEGEILGQVRDAWKDAEREGTVRQHLPALFRHAVEVGKRARTETGIARRAVSVSSAAVWLAAERLGSLAGRRVLVLGAGEMGEGMVVALAGAGVAEVVVANRTARRGSDLARRVGGRAIGLDALPDALEIADLFLTSTTSDDIVIDRADLEDVMARRPGRPLLIVDIAVPRDVDPAASGTAGVTLLDIDDLKAFVDQSMDSRRREVESVRAIVTQEVGRYGAERSARELAPLVRALRERGEEVRRAELERFRAKLEGLDPEARDAVEALTKRLVNKLLHAPTVRVKEEASGADGETYADVLADLFDL